MGFLNTWLRSNVFNADEAVLFFKALPDKTTTFKGDTCIARKRSKERVTVLLATNMTGTERLPLLVIGKAQKCFENVRRLPVYYQANKKALMTSGIFQSWIRQLDRHYGAEKRKVLMVVENCSAHCKMSSLVWIKLVFLPPNATAALQPMDQGIIQYIKCKYRKNVLQCMLLCMEGEKKYDLTLPSTLNILCILLIF